ncbi:MAG: hypothetical protein M5U28_19830 [Sandaracinaceae bacterium]|nr:hypothetical protein [Sandaracinaceae bacterium]
MRGSDAILDPGVGFRWELAWKSERVLAIAYAGHVPAGDGHVREVEAMVRAAPPPVGVCYDVTLLAGFHRAQVVLHGQSLARLAPRVAGIALVGAGPAARFGAVTVSLLSKLPLATFDTPPEAIAWLESVCGRALAFGRFSATGPRSLAPSSAAARASLEPSRSGLESTRSATRLER